MNDNDKGVLSGGIAMVFFGYAIDSSIQALKDVDSYCFA